MRGRWLDLDYWRWRASGHGGALARAGAAMLGLLLVVFGGFLTADWLTSAGASTGTGSEYTLETTVTKLVTVRDHGRTRIKRVPVVRRVVVHPGTRFITTTTPGGVHVVRQSVLRYVPVVKKRIVTIHGKTRTLTETRIVPTVRTQTQVQTQTNVVTNQQTVVNQVTVVDRRTETVVQPVTVVQTETETVTETRTVTAPPETVVITVTLPAITITDPGG
jgi:hypothetical protein